MTCIVFLLFLPTAALAAILSVHSLEFVERAKAEALATAAADPKGLSRLQPAISHELPVLSTLEALSYVEGVEGISYELFTALSSSLSALCSMPFVFRFRPLFS